jgi:hypothetical protein
MDQPGVELSVPLGSEHLDGLFEDRHLAQNG